MAQEQEQRKENRPPREGRGAQGAPQGQDRAAIVPAVIAPASEASVEIAGTAATAADSIAAVPKARPKSSSKSSSATASTWTTRRMPS